MIYKLPKRHLSYSQLYCYLQDPKEYYLQYYMGKDFMAELYTTNRDRWEQIRLGAIFSDAYGKPVINWKKKLQADGFTSDKQRIIETALIDKNLIRLPASKCEMWINCEHEGIPLVIKPDGFDSTARLLIENKFGAVRKQEYVDEDLQLSFYALGIKKVYGFIPKIILQSVNSATGKVIQIQTKRDKSDLEHVGELIVKVAESITKGIFEKEEIVAPDIVNFA